MQRSPGPVPEKEWSPSTPPPQAAGPRQTWGAALLSGTARGPQTADTRKNVNGKRAASSAAVVPLESIVELRRWG